MLKYNTLIHQQPTYTKIDMSDFANQITPFRPNEKKTISLPSTSVNDVIPEEKPESCKSFFDILTKPGAEPRYNQNSSHKNNLSPNQNIANQTPKPQTQSEISASAKREDCLPSDCDDAEFSLDQTSPNKQNNKNNKELKIQQFFATNTECYTNIKEERQERLNDAQILWNVLAKNIQNSTKESPNDLADKPVEIIAKKLGIIENELLNTTQAKNIIHDIDLKKKDRIYIEENQSWQQLDFFSRFIPYLNNPIQENPRTSQKLTNNIKEFNSKTNDFQNQHLICIKFDQFMLNPEIITYEELLNQGATQPRDEMIIDSQIQDINNYDDLLETNDNSETQATSLYISSQPKVEYIQNNKISNTITEQVKASLEIIVKSAPIKTDFTQIIRANLTPPQLGKIQISYAISTKNSHNIEINVEKIITLRLLQENMAELKTIVRDFANYNSLHTRTIPISSLDTSNQQGGFNNSNGDNTKNQNPTINFSLNYNQNHQQNNQQNTTQEFLSDLNSNDNQTIAIEGNAAEICAYLVCGDTRIDIYV